MSILGWIKGKAQNGVYGLALKRATALAQRDGRAVPILAAGMVCTVIRLAREYDPMFGFSDIERGGGSLQVWPADNLFERENCALNLAEGLRRSGEALPDIMMQLVGGYFSIQRRRDFDTSTPLEILNLSRLGVLICEHAQLDSGTSLGDVFEIAAAYGNPELLERAKVDLGG